MGEGCLKSKQIRDPGSIPNSIPARDRLVIQAVAGIDAVMLQDALTSLPRGRGFRFVDELVELVPGKSGVARYLIPQDESFFTGHFLGNPILPGVILIEAIAQ